jgi:hypothetical protein
MTRVKRFVFMDLRDLTTSVVEKEYVGVTFYLASSPITFPENTVLGTKLTPDEARELAQGLLRSALLAESNNA